MIGQNKKMFNLTPGGNPILSLGFYTTRTVTLFTMKNTRNSDSALLLIAPSSGLLLLTVWKLYIYDSYCTVILQMVKHYGLEFSSKCTKIFSKCFFKIISQKGSNLFKNRKRSDNYCKSFENVRKWLEKVLKFARVCLVLLRMG